MSRLLAVIVGCNYADRQRPRLPPLHAAENDARRLSAFLQTAPLVKGELGMQTLLTGASATTLNIRAAIERTLAAHTLEDTLLFYFSGHGQKTDDGLVLYLADADLHARELLNLFDTNAPVRMILDCCHAGAIETAKHTKPG